MENIGTLDKTDLPNVCLNFQNKIMWNFRASSTWIFDHETWRIPSKRAERIVPKETLELRLKRFEFWITNLHMFCSCSKGVWLFLMEFLFIQNPDQYFCPKRRMVTHIVANFRRLRRRRSWIHVIARCCWWCGSPFTVRTSRSNPVS